MSQKGVIVMTATDNLLAILDRAESQLPAAEPIFMLNLLRYRNEAIYESDETYAPCTGREAYFTRYIPAFANATEGYGIEPFWIGKVGSLLVAPADELWDDIALIRYPDFATFRHMVDSKEYHRDAEPHRLAALADWRLVALTRMPNPH
ncbi:hypothetical protein ASF69_09600 [Rhizobium sp. Leaf311]|jgi:hypothetical protein|nr:hypothetical protein ASF69_09600 [Rhizobium sp. Leaf311]